MRRVNASFSAVDDASGGTRTASQPEMGEVMRAAVAFLFLIACDWTEPCDEVEWFEDCADECSEDQQECGDACRTERCIEDCFEAAQDCTDDCMAAAPTCGG